MGKCSRALADRGAEHIGVSILREGESLSDYVADERRSPPAGVEKHLRGDQRRHRAGAHRPGESCRAAALGESKINTDYVYLGPEPDSSRALVVFGVDNLTKAVAVLDELAVAVT